MRPRVLLVDAADTRGLIYGAQQVILDLVSSSGEAVAWAAATVNAEGPYPAALRAAGVAGHALPLRARLPVARRALRALLAAQRPDVVHVHDLRAGAIARGPAAAAGCRQVTSYHELLYYDHLRGAARLRRRLQVLAEARSAALADRAICVSQAVAAQVQRLLPLPPERLLVVPNGVQPARLQAAASPAAVSAARTAAGLSDSARVVLCVGSLTARKGQATLLQAAPAVLAAVPATRFVLVGDGPDRPALTALATRLGVLPACRFVGFRTPVAPWMALAEVVAVPSRGEAFGLVAVEALALGRPVLAAATGGLAEVLVDGESGRLLPPAQPAAWAAALGEVLTQPGCAAGWVAAGQARVAALFAQPRVTAAVLAVYAALGSSR
ncbi:MAG: glycosyltransferase family 4 protein [Fimbriimonadaceae bacterium]|nr:glycosyltransferase family 4 protein [Fimbriimonadaceae bacterium]